MITTKRLPFLRFLRFLPLALTRRLGPATLVALGLVSMLALVLVLVDLAVPSFFTHRTEALRRDRQAIAQRVGSEVVRSMASRGLDGLPVLLAHVVRREQRIASAALIGPEGTVALVNEHDTNWRLLEDQPSTTANLRLPLNREGVRWGELQLAFAAVPSESWAARLRQPAVQGVLLMLVLAFFGFQLYLRRAMVYLDPTAAVPDRVRTALDTLSEGVLVIDGAGNVLLANRVVRSWMLDGADPVGRPVQSVDWLAAAAARLPDGAPWTAVLATGTSRQGDRLTAQIAGVARHFIVNCSPVGEAGAAVPGCLLTLTDVTALEERTDRLRLAVEELEASREEIRQKNDELVLLATRDPLTGCLNRRAFEAEGNAALNAAAGRGAAVSCVMCDIDHFKKVNDTYGHAGGDVVLQAAAKALSSQLRTGDLLARFGGEEFCILLPDTPLEQARAIAERLRAVVEAGVGGSLRQPHEVRVTMSFGVEQFGVRRAKLDGVIDLADQALYHSKKSGRNRVTAYSDLPVGEPEPVV